MSLPTEEQNLLNLLLAAKGNKMRAVLIAKELGIQDNHCNKLIKHLRDKGYWIQNEYDVVNGVTKKYKKHWIDPNAVLKPVKEVESKVIDNVIGHQEPSLCACGESWWTKNGMCNNCGRKR